MSLRRIDESDYSAQSACSTQNLYYFLFTYFVLVIKGMLAEFFMRSLTVSMSQRRHCFGFDGIGRGSPHFVQNPGRIGKSGAARSRG